jgi:Cof subfamily protein (haloacid dehalogenase superfamily)
VKLVAVSVDGTLLRSDGRLPQSVVHACREAEGEGAVIVLATARPPRSTRSLLEALDLGGPTINYNGAVIWNPREREAQFHEPLEADLARQVIAAARGATDDILVGVEVLDRWFTDRVDPGVRTRSGQPLDPDAIGPLEQFLDGPVTQLNFFGPSARVEAVRRVVDEQFWRLRLVALFQPQRTLLQVTHPMVDKGIALQRVAKRLGIEQASVMAIGSAANDRGMIEWAGFAVAMANAESAVKRLARAEVPSNDENGVAIALQRFVPPCLPPL